MAFYFHDQFEQRRPQDVKWFVLIGQDVIAELLLSDEFGKIDGSFIRVKLVFLYGNQIVPALVLIEQYEIIFLKHTENHNIKNCFCKQNVGII